MRIIRCDDTLPDMQIAELRAEIEANVYERRLQARSRAANTYPVAVFTAAATASLVVLGALLAWFFGVPLFGGFVLGLSSTPMAAGLSIYR